MQVLIKWAVQFYSASHNEVGRVGEHFASDILKEAGFWVAETERGTKCGDLRIARKDTGEEFDIEVKTSKRGAEGYQFCLRRDGGKTDCSHSDYVLLLAVADSGATVPFLIPTSHIPASQKLIKIRSLENMTKRGWGKYRFELSDMFSFWRLVNDYQMFGESPYHLKWDIQLAPDLEGEVEITVGG